jgi:hypothetical protein
MNDVFNVSGILRLQQGFVHAASRADLQASLHLVGSACIYGQVIKTRRKNRVIRVEEWRKHPAARSDARDSPSCPTCYC